MNQLLLFQREGGISLSDQEISTVAEIKKAHHTAYSSLKALQKKHHELRESYLEDLAEAIVLERAPQLAETGLEHLHQDKSAKQLKQLISREVENV